MTNIESSILNTVVTQIESNDKVKKAMLDKLEKSWIVPQTIIHKIPKRGRQTMVIKNQHFKFDTIMKTIGAWINIALVWPAWGWKTTLVENIAKWLQVEFYAKSVSAQTSIYEFFGYMEATWKYVPTLFRKAYEKGWVFLVDEFDAWNPNVLASLNQATANGCCAFPDKMVTKHPKFTIVMAWNTYWTWATAEYVGRNKIDGATLDRFAFVELPYDNQMELNASTNKEWCKYIQKVRQRAEDKKVKVIISPRATFFGQELIEAWVEIEEIKKMLIFKGLSKDEVNLIDIKFTPAKKEIKI